MSQGARRPAPPAQLCALLARYRREAVSFDTAWELAAGKTVTKADGTLDLQGGQVRWPHETDQRRQWKQAAIDTREEWRACYEGRTTPTSQHLARVISVLQPDDHDDLRDLPRVAVG